MELGAWERGAAVVALAAIAVGLTGCVSVRGSEGGEICVSLDPGAEIVIGDIVTISGGSATLESVSLADAAGIEAGDAYAVPLAGGAAGIGTMSLEDLAARTDVLPAVGLSLEEGEYAVGLKVTRTGDEPGTTPGFRVTVRDDRGRESTSQGKVSFTLTDSCF